MFQRNTHDTFILQFIFFNMAANPGGMGAYITPIFWGYHSNIFHHCLFSKFTDRKHAKFNRIDHFQHDISNIFDCGAYLGNKLSFLQSKEQLLSRLQSIDYPLQFSNHTPNVEDGFASLFFKHQ